MRAALKRLRDKRTSHDNSTSATTLSPNPQSTSFSTRLRRLSAPASPQQHSLTSPIPPRPPATKSSTSAPPKAPDEDKKDSTTSLNDPPPYVLVSEYQSGEFGLSNHAFLEAIKRHEARLSADERSDFTSPVDALMMAKTIDEAHHSKSDSRKFAVRIEGILKGMNRYMGVVKTCIQHNPEVSSLAVGGIMFVLNLAIEFAAFFDKLTDMIERIERHLSYLSKYAERVFQRSEAVQEALIHTYEDLLTFCCETRKVFVGSGGRIARQTSFRIFLRNVWDPFEVKFGNIERRFLENAALVVAEAQAQEFLDASLRREEERYREALKFREEADERRGTILKSLNANDYEDTHRQIFAKRHRESGQWLIDSDEYQSWIAGSGSKLLWCYGYPGVGKTVLTSLVIEDLSTRFPVSQDTGVAFAYASYKDIDSSQNPKTFISSFILQLSRQREGLMPELDAFYSANRKDARDPTFTTLRGLLLSILVHFNTVYIVFDALDEVEQRAELLKFLTELVPKNNKAEVGKCAVKLFVTSRKERDIESRFCEASSIRIRATKVSADIDAYIQDELDRRIKNQQLHIQGIDNLKDKILQTLSRRADGMFLWVVYQLDHICNKSDLEGAQGVLDALEALPESMDEYYARVLVNIDRQPDGASKLARKTLLWVAFARQPMSLAQLVTAIAIDDNHTRFSDLRMMPEPKKILQITGNLLAVNGSKQVQFVHYSAKEYLLRSDTERPRGLTSEDWTVVQRYRISEEEAHMRMFKSCFDFMMFPEFENYLHSKTGYTKWLSRSPFVAYAAAWWSYHMEAITKAHESLLSPVLERLEKLLDPGSRYLHIMTNSKMVSLDHKTTNYFAFCCPKTLSFILKFPETYGLLEITNHPLACIRPINPVAVPDKDYRTMVRWMCRHYSAIHEYEAFITDPYILHNLPVNLRIASSLRRRQLVEYLLGLEISPNTVDPQGKLPLTTVAAKRDTPGSDGLEIIKILISHGGNPNLIDERSGPALLPAVRIAVEHPSKTNGTKIPVYLLENGADPNVVSSNGTALASACAIAAASTVSDPSIALSIINLLLDYGADVNLPCPVHGSALMAATSAAAAATPGSGTRGIALTKLLLSRGANPNFTPPSTQSDRKFGTVLATAIQAACSRGVSNGRASDIVTILLKAGANINAIDSCFGSALIVAAAAVAERRRGPALDILKLLLEKGADPNLVSPEFGTALEQAASSAVKSAGKRAKAVNMLLDAGARVDVQGHRSVLEAVREAARQVDGEGWRENYILKLVERRKLAAKEIENDDDEEKGAADVGGE